MTASVMGRAGHSQRGRWIARLAIPTAVAAVAATAGLAAPATAQAADPVAQVTTGSCAEFMGGTSTALDAVSYQTGGGATITDATPGSFSYYVKIVAPASSFQVVIPQTVPATGPTFPISAVNAYTYAAPNCNAYGAVSASVTAGRASVLFPAATRGNTYVIRLQYNAGSIVGMTPPTPANVTYNFNAQINGISVASASQNLGLDLAATVTTQLSATSIKTGQTVTDTATLTGVTDPSGTTIDYTAFPTLADCEAGSNQTEQHTVDVTTAGPQETATFTDLTTVGTTYYLDARWSGDETYPATSSPCESEHVTVTKWTPTITTTPSDTSIQTGATVTDSAELGAGTFSSDVTGTVTYKVFGSLSDCQDDTNALDSDQVNVTANTGVVPNSTAFDVFHTVKTYYLSAAYSGDDHNQAATSDCASEAVAVTGTVTTALSDNSIAVGGSVTDTATLNGATAPSGTVDFRYYRNLDVCQGDTSAFPGTQPTGGTNAGKVNVTGTAVTSASATFDTAGTYYWAAFYSGDGTYAALASDCTAAAEKLEVSNSAAPTLNTSLSAAKIPVGGSVHDSATLTGVTNDAGGHVTYNVYDSADCSGTAAVTQQVNVTNGVVPDSQSVTFAPPTFTTPGTFSWEAVYDGDAHNLGATSDCETLTVLNSPSAQVTLTPSTLHVTAGVAETAMATLTGVTSDASGNVTYNIYSTRDLCLAGGDGDVHSNGPVAVANATVAAADTYDFAGATVGNTYFWSATYSGDANNAGATSACVRVVVTA